MCFQVFFLCICYVSSVFLVFARENTIFLRVLCHFLSFCLIFPRENIISERIPCHLVGKTLFSYGFGVISLGVLGFPWGKALFPCGLRRNGVLTDPWVLKGLVWFCMVFIGGWDALGPPYLQCFFACFSLTKSSSHNQDLVEVEWPWSVIPGIPYVRIY